MSDQKMSEIRCKACDKSQVVFWNESDAPQWGLIASICKSCIPNYPESLLKACADEFDYLLELRTGTRVRFSRADISGAFVHLEDIREFDSIPLDSPYSGNTFDRGIDVRTADIVWCVDAPHGS